MPRYLFKEEIFMYLLVFMYLFIYLHHDPYGNSELCWSAKAKVRGGGGHYKRIERQCGREKERKKDCSGRGLTQRWHLGHIKSTFWKIFVFIFYDRFCTITDFKTDGWKAEANRKREQTEWKTCRRKELPGRSEQLRLTYFCCILVIYKRGFGGHKLRTTVC